MGQKKKFTGSSPPTKPPPVPSREARRATELRLERGLNQKDVERKSGGKIKQNYLSMVEDGSIQNPRSQFWVDLAKVYDVSIYEFLPGTRAPDPQGSLREFLESPEGADVSPWEREQLLRTDWPFELEKQDWIVILRTVVRPKKP